jgi:hypothetical protein
VLHHIHLNVVQGVLYTHRVTSDVMCVGTQYRCFRVVPKVCIYTPKWVDRTTYLSTNNNMLCVSHSTSTYNAVVVEVMQA